MTAVQELTPANGKQRFNVTSFCIIALLLFSGATYVGRDRDASGVNIVQGIATLSTLSTALVVALFGLRRTRTADVVVTRAGVAGVAIFALLTAVSAVNSWSMLHSVTRTAVYTGVVLAAALAAKSAGPYRFIESMYYALVCFLTAGLMIGIALPEVFPLLLQDDWDFRSRLVVFKCTPVYTAYMAGTALLLGLAVQRRVRHVRFIQAYVLVMHLCAVTRWSTVCLMIAVGIYYSRDLFSSSRAVLRTGAVTALTISAVLLISIIMPDSFMPDSSTLSSIGVRVDISRLSEGFDNSPQGLDLNGRVEVWEEVLNRVDIGILLGYGFEGHRQIMRNLSDWADHAHNGVLELLLTSGVIGSFAMIFAIGAILRLQYGGRAERYVWCGLAVIAFTALTTAMDPMFFSALGAVVLGSGLVGVQQGRPGGAAQNN